jgi:hypothetical protein
MSIVGLLLVGVLAYGALSLLIAGATSGHCGDFASDKDWNFWPPGWECEY